MSDKVKIALIFAGTAVAITAVCIYFSPYRSCVRAYNNPDYVAEVACADIIQGR